MIIFRLFIIAIFLFSYLIPVHAASFADRLAGQILLQVESKGEAWYVDPIKKERWYLGRPADALVVMKKLGLGVSNANLVKIPRVDTNDRGDAKFTKRFSGRIILQVEELGQAWYVHLKEQRRYYLGRPADAFYVMNQVGVGITNVAIATIPIAKESAVPALLIIASPPPSSPAVSAPVANKPADVLSSPSASPEILSQASADFRTELLALINDERRKKSIGDLAANATINRVAQEWSADMALRNYFDMKNPEGLGTMELLKNGGYEPRTVGTLAASGPSDARSVFALWNDEKEGSKGIFIRSEYEDFGVGMTRGADGQPLWVALFASSEVKYEERVAASLSDMNAIRQAMLARVNQERTMQGLPTLVFNEFLNQSAQKKSEDMFTKDYFAHESLEGVTPHQLITSTGYPARISAENLAKGPQTADEVMTGWMNSPGHRANILLQGIEEAGFGLKFGRNASGFNLYWTQHFGKR